MRRRTWTDERLDDLSDRIDKLEVRVDAGFKHVDSTLHGIQRTMIVGLASIAVAALGGHLF